MTVMIKTSGWNDRQIYAATINNPRNKEKQQYSLYDYEVSDTNIVARIEGYLFFSPLVCMRTTGTKRILGDGMGQWSEGGKVLNKYNRNLGNTSFTI